MNVLFLCVANSARSQMAEGLAKKIWGRAVNVQSAGSKPSKVNPFAIQVMQDIGIDITSHHSKSFDDLDPAFSGQLDYVITLCAEEVCPVLASKATKLHWPLPDPATKDMDETVLLAQFRATRDALAEKIQEFGGRTFG